jgi:hypothetical protein
MAQFWVYSTTARSCGRCGQTIPGGAVALKMRLQSAPHVSLWRCTDCVGAPPADVVAAAEAAAVDEAALARDSIQSRLGVILERVFGRRFDFDAKRRQAGDGDEA